MRNSSARSAGLTDDRFAQLKATLEDGIDSITSGEDWKRYLEFQARFYRYSFTNMMLVLMQRPDATMVQARGERKDGKHTGWKALGRTVVEGREESGKIFIWKPWTRTEEAAEGQKPKSYVKFFPVPVYDVSDTEGDPIPEGATVRLLEGDDARGLLKLTLEFIEGNGWTYEFLPSIAGSEANGDCSPTEKHIRVCTRERDEKQQAKTAIHEAAHMLLHSGGKGISIPREQKEIEAESVAFIVSAHLGVDTGDYSFGYVAGWSAATGFSHRTALKHSGKRIQSAAKKIIAAIEGDGADEGEEDSA